MDAEPTPEEQAWFAELIRLRRKLEQAWEPLNELRKKLEGVQDEYSAAQSVSSDAYKAYIKHANAGPLKLGEAYPH